LETLGRGMWKNQGTQILAYRIVLYEKLSLHS
jgi:hypothetical protein